MSQEIIQKLATAKTTEERRTTCEELADKYVKSMGAAKAFKELKLQEKISQFVGDKKNAGARESAYLLVAALAESLEEAGEPYLVPLLPLVLDGYGDKQEPVRHAAEVAGQALMSIPTPHAVKVLLPHLLDALSEEKKWQTKTGTLKLLGELAHTAARQIDVALPKIVPVVSRTMWDSKPEVRQAAGDCCLQVCATVSNIDLHKFIPILVGCIQDPTKVPETVHQLASTTFVTAVEAPSLAIMAPILNRGLTERTPAVLRQTSVIIDNMCKLVEDPVHAEQFLPKLLPGLNRIIEVQADPELRNVATRAKTTLVRVGGGDENVPEEDATETAKRAQEAHDTASKHVKESLGGSAQKVDAETVDYLASLVTALDDAREYDATEWHKLSGYLESFMSVDAAKKVCEALCAIYTEVDSHRQKKKNDVDPDEGEELCNCEFSLAYGAMILLNNTRLRLTRGQRYALCGPNGVGKSTLMRAISNGQLDGFPPRDELKTVFVEHNLQGSDAEKNVLEFVTTDPEFEKNDKAEIKETLLSVGFDEEKQALPVTALSGGWKMKLELARAMLMKADILLLDEPTNHLDVKNVAWLENYLTSLTNVTSIIVSHDSSFIDHVCTHVIHYETRKLKVYKGNLSEFVKKKPEAKAYYELASDTHHFRFPEPGFLEGVKSKDRAILKLLDVSFTYPGMSKPTIMNISVQCSLNSRVACIGPNGAGKSTMIKVLTGETEPTDGDVYKHPNLRVAYVAQHAFHHVEQHLDKTPNEYIRWRYQYGEDKELKSKVSRQLSEEDQKAFETPINVEGEKRRVDDIVGRRKYKKSYEYEIKWIGMTWEDNTWYPRDKLEQLGFEKFLQAFDDKEAAREGMYARPLTAAAVQKHLSDVGLEAEFSTHSRIRGLSGGQKVKVVIAAAMWNNPHMLVLDEPTNYLDRDSLGALAGAIREYGGGVVIISHHSEFTDALCPEKWSVDAGRCTVTGGNVPTIQEKLVQKQEETKTDAMGNVTKIKIKKKLSRKELMAAKKVIMQKQKDGRELTESEDELCLENNW